MKSELALILGVFFLSSCGLTNKKTASADSANCDSSLTYDANIKTIVTANCVGCHSSGSSNGNFSTLSALQADKDEVYSEVSSGKMPQGNSGFKDSADGRSLIAWLSCSTLK